MQNKEVNITCQKDSRSNVFLSDKGSFVLNLVNFFQCMERWNARSVAQQTMLEREQILQEQQEKEHAENVQKRESIVARQRKNIDSK